MCIALYKNKNFDNPKVLAVRTFPFNDKYLPFHAFRVCFNNNSKVFQNWPAELLCPTCTCNIPIGFFGPSYDKRAFIISSIFNSSHSVLFLLTLNPEQDSN